MHLASAVRRSIRAAVISLVVTGFIFASGCTGADKSRAPSSATKTHPSGLRMTLNGPSVIKDEPQLGGIFYEAYVENHGPKPIAIAVHPLWLRLEFLTPDEQKVEVADYNEVDWVPPADRDLVIIKPGEKRIFEAFCPGRPQPGTYKLLGVILPSPTDIPEHVIRAMRDEDATFLKSECRSPTVTVKVL